MANNDRPTPAGAGTAAAASGGVRYATSADGTEIAYERLGNGPPVILVAGALNDRNGRASGVPLARLLASRFTAYAYDRRGRGASRATRPYSVQGEIDDLAALVAAAGAGGSAALFGMSSGCALVLRAAAAGVTAGRIALYDPPFTTDAESARRMTSYDARLAQLIDAGDNDAALALFLATIGMPPPAIEGMRRGPAWRSIAALAPTLAHDSAVLDNQNGGGVPAAAIAKIAAPMLVVAGELSGPGLRKSAEAVAAAARHGTFRVLAGQSHDVQVDALAPVLIEFFAA
jgi:pimeloyl-ACP methyl ester carboxylesterase